jgi:hypothetical protein
LNLISEHAIMVLPEEDKEPEYAIVRATRQQMPGDAFSAMDARNLQQAKDIRDLLYHIEQNNGKFTIAELKEYLERAARYDKSRIDAVDDFLLRFEALYQFVARDKDGRLWRRWPTIVTPPSVTPPPPASVAPTQSPSAAGQQTTFGRHSTATPSPPLNDPTQRIDR